MPSPWKANPIIVFMNGDDLERMREHGEYAEDGHYSDELDGGESFQVSPWSKIGVAR